MKWSVGQLSASCFVPGVPIPKGSTKAFPFKRKNGKLGVAVTAANDKLKPWQNAIAEIAKNKLSWNGEVWPGAVSMTALFYLPRPKSLKQSVLFHLKKPDLDKLARAVGDALVGIAYVDDSQIIAWHKSKTYAIGECVGVQIQVERVL